MKLIYCGLVLLLFFSLTFAAHPCVLDTNGNIIDDCSHQWWGDGTKDSLVIDPGAPTTSDSITFQIYFPAHSCCAIYADTAIVIQDTIIYLQFSVDSSLAPLCFCIAPGNWLILKTGPIAAGTYGVYEAPQNYCPPTQFCIEIAPPPPVRIGEVTVSGTTSGKREVFFSRTPKIQVFPNPFSKSVTVNFENFGVGIATVEIFNINGKRIRRFNNIKLPNFNWQPPRMSEGTYLIRVQQGTNQFSKKVLLKR